MAEDLTHTSGPSGAAVVETSAPPAQPPGFDLLDEVGRGGMGVVYRARDLALDREVAVKLLQEQYEPDSATAARFVEEARITGQLQHPGIPAVYQVGTLPGGRPFLAMKLIKGDTLDALLKQNTAATPGARRGSPDPADGPTLDPLSVLEAIAQAVGYAHAHGVIHRDLKPANVMVGNFGEVQVMDWGLAKVLASVGASARRGTGADPEATCAATVIKSLRDTDGSHTQAGSILGTPAFMAPEQAAGEHDKIDARADVFGLGAILCVLLTGKPPFVGHDAESVRLAAVRGKTEEAFARLDGCGADPDVAALCKRCLAFEPADRPASGDAVAAAVAALRRAADDRARQAERDKLSAEVRAAEQAKRRRAVLWAAVVVVAVLLLGVAGTGIGLYWADAARRAAVAAEQATEQKRQEAEAARAEAQAKEAEANAVIKYFEDHVFAAGRPKGQGGGRGSAVSLRDAILAGLPALDKAFADQPLVEARLRSTLGITFHYLAEAERAAEQHERARALFTHHRGPEHPDTLRSMNNLALSYAALNRQTEALKLCEETLVAMKRVLPPYHPDTLRSMNNLALSYAVLNRHADALKLQEETLAAQKRVLPLDDPDTLGSMVNLGNSYSALGRNAEAVKVYEEALPVMKAKMPEHSFTFNCMNNLALSYAALNRHAEALKLNEETLAARKRVLPPDHPNTLMSMNNLAVSYYALNRHAEALKLREETLAARKRVLPPDHPDTLGSMVNLGSSYFALGRNAEAVKVYEEALPVMKAKMPEHSFTFKCMHNLADSYAALNRHTEALKLREETLAARKRVLPPDHPDTLNSMWGVAESLVKLDRGAEAIPLIDECVAKAAGKAVHPRLIPTVIVLRLRHFQKAGDPAGCRATAVMWENLNRTDANSLYGAACFRAVAAAVQAKDPAADSRRAGIAQEDADRAMAWLTRAVAAGFKNKAHMEKDPNLDFLRDRDDFKKLIAELKEPANP